MSPRRALTAPLEKTVTDPQADSRPVHPQAKTPSTPLSRRGFSLQLGQRFLYGLGLVFLGRPVAAASFARRSRITTSGCGDEHCDGWEAMEPCVPAFDEDCPSRIGFSGDTLPGHCWCYEGFPPYEPLERCCDYYCGSCGQGDFTTCCAKSDAVDEDACWGAVV